MRLLPILLLLASPLSAATLSGVSAGQPDAWFSATFDGAVRIVHTEDGGGCTPNPCWRWNLVGADASGFRWSQDLNNGMSCFAHIGATLVPTAETLTDYIDVQLVNLGGEHGTVLMQKVIDDQVPGNQFTSRSEYRCRLEEPSETTLNDGYIAFDIYFQPDLATQCETGTFCFLQLGEVHDYDDQDVDQWRITHGISRLIEDDHWDWVIGASNYNPCCGAPSWTYRYTKAVVGGQWYRYEYEWTSDLTNGTIKVWIDGSLMFDKSGIQTMEDATYNKHYYDMFSLYTDAIVDNDGDPSPTWTYIDNLVICGSRAECG